VVDAIETAFMKAITDLVRGTLIPEVRGCLEAVLLGFEEYILKFDDRQVDL
jgi:hypothetical protein